MEILSKVQDFIMKQNSICEGTSSLLTIHVDSIAIK